ncbi:hypothetical protein HDU85_000863 [Gaertneriomyces sp. JEL0708]|nr:hypothetical protein HDU85_000863 [Gaertneriomyces sp. JEL0708]
MFSTVINDLQPHVTKTFQASITFRHQVQPWHPQGVFLHETAMAVHKLSPTSFWPVSTILFAAQDEFSDAKTVNLSRAQLYEKLIDLVTASDKIDVSKDELTALLMPKSSNEGNEITPVLKTHLKLTRHNSVHVSPTVLINGLVVPQISSSWQAEQWKEYLDKFV